MKVISGDIYSFQAWNYLNKLVDSVAYFEHLALDNIKYICWDIVVVFCRVIAEPMTGLYTIWHHVIEQIGLTFGNKFSIFPVLNKGADVEMSRDTSAQKMNDSKHESAYAITFLNVFFFKIAFVVRKWHKILMICEVLFWVREECV